MTCEHWKHLALVANQKMLVWERERAELRAEVEALPGWQYGDAVLREDVLALLDGRQE